MIRLQDVIGRVESGTRPHGPRYPLVGCVEGRVAPGAATERPRADNHGLASFLADTSPDRREMLVIQQSILFLIQAVTQFSFLVLNFLPHKPIR